jgi:hypothetical protein
LEHHITDQCENKERQEGKSEEKVQLKEMKISLVEVIEETEMMTRIFS